MPAEVATPVTKPRRLTFRRILFALVLGLATWWGVGWWLSPRAMYTFSYPELGPLQSKTEDGRDYADFEIYTLDGEKYLTLRPNVPDYGLVTLEWRAMPTGRLESSQTYSLDEYIVMNRSYPKGKRLLDTSVNNRPNLNYSNYKGTIPPAPEYCEVLAIPGSHQSIRVAETRHSFGSYLDGILKRLPFVTEWLGDVHVRVGIWNAETRSFMWSIPETYGPESNVRITASDDLRFVVFDQLNEKRHNISVLTFPMANGSPWWPHSAGLLITTLVLFARRGRRGGLCGLAACH